MSSLEFRLGDWLFSSLDDPLERETLAALCITAGQDWTFTEVQDLLAQSVRDHIHVPAHSLATWLLANWWRLRWEPWRDAPSQDWLHGHSMAAIGGGYAWPALTFASDGEFIQLRLESERAADVSSVRYLRDLTVDVPALEFERAIEKLVDAVQSRTALRVPGSRELAELREELQEERSDPVLNVQCKRQALAGIDPGAATEDWLSAADALANQAGVGADDEVFAALPALSNCMAGAMDAIAAMRASACTVDLSWTTVSRWPGASKGKPWASEEKPWERGTRLARELRSAIGLPAGPVATSELGELLHAKLPFAPSAWRGPRNLVGGYRDANSGQASLLVTKRREDSQRFYLARVIAAACASNSQAHVLPVSDTATALQKFERSFAQEFLCPWSDLHAFIDEHGMDEDGITEAAEHFVVSELVVLSTLVSKHELPRSRLHPWSAVATG